MKVFNHCSAEIMWCLFRHKLRYYFPPIRQAIREQRGPESIVQPGTFIIT